MSGELTSGGSCPRARDAAGAGSPPSPARCRGVPERRRRVWSCPVHPRPSWAWTGPWRFCSLTLVTVGVTAGRGSSQSKGVVPLAVTGVGAALRGSGASLLHGAGWSSPWVRVSAPPSVAPWRGCAPVSGGRPRRGLRGPPGRQLCTRYGGLHPGRVGATGPESARFHPASGANPRTGCRPASEIGWFRRHDACQPPNRVQTATGAEIRRRSCSWSRLGHRGETREPRGPRPTPRLPVPHPSPATSLSWVTSAGFRDLVGGFTRDSGSFSVLPRH